MATVDPTINDTLTNVQLRQIRQKLEEEKRRRGNQEQNADLNGSNIKLLQAVLERQELLNKLQQEQKLRDDLIRPASYNDKPARSTSPRMTQRRSESQPVLLQTYDTTGPRQVVEHQFKPIRLEPLENPPKPPAILQTSLPTPYLVNVPPPQQNTKAEMMEMMMLQNAQMHQMIMNQLMIQAMPKPPQDAANTKRVVEADDVIIRKRASPVHYYEATPRVQQQPVYTLPPVAPVPVAYPTPRYYPMELEPLKYPRAKKKEKPKPPPVTTPKKKVYGSLPFPGPWPLRRFRHYAYAIFFQKVLEKLLRKKRGRVIPHTEKESDQDFMFSIKLKEVVSALHFIYLEPTNKIGRILREFSEDGAKNLVASINSDRSSERNKAISDIEYILENIIYEMTDIMPADGVLGTHKKAHVVDMCREGKLYPRGYLWQIEKDLLHLDYSDRTRNVGDFESYVLLLGIFLPRAIITTLLLKPVQYELVRQQPGPAGKKNLKLLASLFMYLYRKMIRPTAQTEIAIPIEVASSLYTDEEMKYVYSTCKDSIAYSEKLIKKWGKEYVKRIRQVIDTEL